MAKNYEQKIQEAVKRDLPGYRVRKQRQTSSPSETESIFPSGSSDAAASPLIDKEETLDFEKLAKKYLRGSYREAKDQTEPDERIVDAGAEESATEAATVKKGSRMVVVEPENAEPLDRGSRSKTVIYSEEEDKIKGFQG